MKRALFKIKIVISMAFLVTGTAQAAPVLGDINGDGKVDFSDFVILAQNFGKSGDPFESDAESDSDTLEVKLLNQQGFPLAIGNVWKYRGVSIENESGSLDVIELNIEWKVEAHEVVFGEPAFRIKTTQSVGGNSLPRPGVYTALTWFSSDPDTLKSVAHEGVPPFYAGQLAKPAILTSPSERYRWRFHILVFPLKPGTSWPAFGNSISGYPRKTVIAKEVISVPAGAFEAYSVEYALRESDNFTYVVWYGDAGILRIVHTISGHPINVVRIYELISYELN